MVTVEEQATAKAADFFIAQAVRYRTEAIGYDLEGTRSACHGIALGLNQAASECEQLAARIAAGELPEPV